MANRFINFYCPHCYHGMEIQVRAIEANSPEGEFNATDCSGAGCTQRPEPGVRGPGKSLTKLESLLESRMAFFDSVTNPGVSHFLINEELYKIHQYVEELIGAEGQDAP